jgi:hypothetical protein
MPRVRAWVARIQLEAEQWHQPDALQAGIAVAERRQRHARRQSLQCIDTVRVMRHFATRGEICVECRLYQRDIVTRRLQHALQRDQSLRGEIMRELGMLGFDFIAQHPACLHCPALGGCWRMRAQPCIQCRFGAIDRRRDWPQGVIQIKGDGADRKKIHVPV